MFPINMVADEDIKQDNNEMDIHDGDGLHAVQEDTNEDMNTLNHRFTFLCTSNGKHLCQMKAPLLQGEERRRPCRRCHK